MDVWFWVLFVAVMVAARASRMRTNAVLTEVQRTSHRWRLPLSWSVHDDAMSRTRRIAMGDAIGGAIGTIVGALLYSIAEPTGYPTSIVIGFFLGMTLGSATAAATQPLTRSPGARIAHAQALSLDDFQPRWITGLTWGVPALAGATFAVLAVTNPSWSWNAQQVGAALILAGSLVSLIGFVFVTRRVVNAPRDAGTDLELAWQDGFAARAVTEVATLTIATSLTAFLLLVLPGVSNGIALVCAISAVGIAGMYLQLQRVFRTRIWQDRVFALEPADLAPATGPNSPATGPNSPATEANSPATVTNSPATGKGAATS